MEMRKYGNKGFTVVEFRGELTMESFTDVKSFVLELVNHGIKDIIIDLSWVSCVDSSGLGALISIMTSINKVKGSLSLVGLTDRVKDLLDVTRLPSFFSLHSTVEDVLLDFQERKDSELEY